MKRMSNILKLFVLVLVLFFQSCNKEEQLTPLSKPQEIDSELDVSENLAIEVAKNFSHDQAFLNNPNQVLSRSQMRSADFVSDKKVKNILTFKDDAGKAALIYAINFEPKGFVLVAGNKKESPILAFSEDGEFTLPEDKTNGIYGWLDFTKTRIKHLKTVKDTESVTSNKTDWQPYIPVDDDDSGNGSDSGSGSGSGSGGHVIISGGTVSEQVGPLTVTTWGQDAGFNNLLATCATGGSGSTGRVPTGCVATATGQIMYYWQHPSNYNWASMNVSSGGGDAPTLMRDLGEPNRLDMNYTCNDGSTAQTSKAAAVLNNYGYANAVYVDYNTFKIRAQLNAGRPIILRGRGLDPVTNEKYGHAWVCDGYRRNKHTSIHYPGTPHEYKTYTYSPLFLRMNWGWGTSSLNTWFRYDNFTPGGDSYNISRKMIINIYR